MTRLSLLLLFAIGCYHDTTPAKPAPPQPTEQQGMLSGTVHFVGMACQNPGPGCDGPLANYEVTILAKDGTTVVAKTTSDATGHFTVALPNGEYTILTPAGMAPTQTRRNDVAIAHSGNVTLDLTIDTGVR
jgi:hypothetical protein